MIARIRKAVVAGFGGGLAAATGVVGKGIEAGTFGEDTMKQALGAFIVAAAMLGWATWRVPNEDA